MILQTVLYTNLLATITERSIATADEIPPHVGTFKTPGNFARPDLPRPNV